LGKGTRKRKDVEIRWCFKAHVWTHMESVAELEFW